jgi:hypothetical protein
VDVPGRGSTRGVIVSLLLSIAAASAQTSSPYQEMAPELAASIAAAVAGGGRVSIAIGAESQTDETAPLVADLTARLTARGLTVGAPADDAAAVRLTCLRNLRERSCTAEIRSDGTGSVAIVTRPQDGAPRDGVRLPVSLALRPLVARRAEILDAATAGDRLFVLDVDAVTAYQRVSGAWQPIESRPLGLPRVWPRDRRGRLRVADGRLEAWLPGVTCAGTAAPLTVACVERRDAWPIGIDNSGLDPRRNHFSTPEGVVFYSVAPVRDATGVMWIVAAPSGTLTWLDGARRASPTSDVAGDIASLGAACSGESTVVVAEPARGGGDVLRLLQAARGRLVAAASPVTVSGTISALWSTPGADTAIVVVRDAAASGYEAFQISVDCGR